MIDPEQAYALERDRSEQRADALYKRLRVQYRSELEELERRQDARIREFAAELVREEVANVHVSRAAHQRRHTVPICRDVGRRS